VENICPLEEKKHGSLKEGAQTIKCPQKEKKMQPFPHLHVEG
jgi:hypothetical protein